MPTYEYQCEKCNQTFEAFQSMKDDAFAICPKKFCRLEVWGEGKVKRLIGTGAGLIFKGTDYRSSNYKESAKKESSSSKGDDAKGSSDKSKESGSSKTEGAKGETGKGGSGSDKGTGTSGSTPSTSG
jgi:putative FmdB family regulatory protein